MENKRRAIKDILHFSVSTWVNFVLSFISTFILTRVFMPDVLGTINLYYSTITAFIYVVCLGLNTGFVRFFNETPNNEPTPLFLFKLLTVSLLFAVLLGIISYLFFADDIVEFFLDRRGRALLICIFLGIIDQVIFRFLNLSLRMRMDIRGFNIQAILINVVTRLSVILGAFIDRSSAEWAIYMNTLCMTGLVIYCLLWQRKEWLPGTLSLSFRGYKTVFIFSLFSVLGSLAVQVNTLASQIVLKTYLGTYAVGIFTSAAIFASVFAALQGGFSNYWSAYMYANYKDEDKREWIREVHDIVTFACIIIIALFFSFRSIIYLFIGEEFRSSKEFFSLILLYPVLLFITETTQYGLSIRKKAHILTIISVISLIINVSIGVAFVPKIGINGMAWGNALSGIVSYTLLTVLGQKNYSSIANICRSCVGVTIIVVLSILAFLFKTDIPVIITSLIAVVLSCLLYQSSLMKIIALSKQYINGLKK
jgi:O-antigen/teichoic acid export membrane protein